MIYRKWSLLTGPVAILGSIVGAVVIADYLFIGKDRFPKPDPRKQESLPASK